MEDDNSEKNDNINKQNIYKMLKEFRNWDADWNTFIIKIPDSANEFVDFLATKYKIILK